MKNFTIQDDAKLVKKKYFLLKNLCFQTISWPRYEWLFWEQPSIDLNKTKIKKLSTTARDLFHFIVEFPKLHNVWCNVQVYLFKDPIQKVETGTCDVLQPCFYDNLFTQKYDRSIISHENLNKNTFQNLLNKLFSLDRQDNGGIIKGYTANKNIKFG